MDTRGVLQYYFHLQWRRGMRLLRDNGFNPNLVLLTGVLLFAFLSYKLLYRFDLGEYIYTGLGISFLSILFKDAGRIDFLKSNFSKSHLRSIRYCESLVVILPFVIGLLFFKYFWLGLGLLLLGPLLGLIFRGRSISYRIPTPFGQRPFEFLRGFRITIILIVASYAIMIIGINVDNFNLALSSIAAIGLVAASYYQEAEPRYYVWLHRMTPKLFLRNKIITLVQYLSVLLCPVMVTLLIWYPENYLTIGLLYIAAVAFVLMSMLAKYVAYPSQVNIIQGLAMGASIFFPPLMLLIIPLFYFKAINRLNPILP